MTNVRIMPIQVILPSYRVNVGYVAVLHITIIVVIAGITVTVLVGTNRGLMTDILTE